jgi:tetratricopeptide (TPR) repeat protein
MRIFSFLAAICFFCLGTLVHGQDVPALLRKADDLDSQGRSDEAINTLKQAEKISPNNPNVLIKLSQDYSDKIDATKDQSQKLGFAKLCLEYAKRAVHEAPDSADAHVCLSIAYGKMTDFTDNKTKMEYSKVVKSEADKNDLALLILARWNFEMATLNPILKAFAQTLYGQMPAASKELAVEYFQRAIAAAPEKIIHHAEFAQALEEMGKNKEAKAEWMKVKQLKATNAEDRRYLAIADQKLK